MTMTTRRALPVAVTAAAMLMLGAAGCSSGGSSGKSAPSGPTTAATTAVTTTAATTAATATATTAGTASSTPAAGAAAITIQNFAFSPATLTVHPGEKVSVTNKDSTAHTVTATPSGPFDTGDIAPGETTEFTAPSKAGTYDYICLIHQFMHGTLTVS
jgi:plastocyanin